MTAISEILQKKLKSICPRSQTSPLPKRIYDKSENSFLFRQILK